MFFARKVETHCRKSVHLHYRKYLALHFRLCHTVPIDPSPLKENLTIVA